MMTNAEAAVHADDTEQWRGLLTTGRWAALGSVLLLPIQVAVFMVEPPPETTVAWFDLLNERPLTGLLSLDLLFVLNNVFVMLVYAAISVVVWRVSRSATTIAMLFVVVGMASYMASNTAFEMLTLAHQYRVADDALRPGLIGAGDAMIANWVGTAFDVYYMLNAVALLLFGWLTLRSPHFSRSTGIVGLIAGVLMLVPSTAGTIGIAMSMLSLIPWAVFAVMVWQHLGKAIGNVQVKPAEKSGSLPGRDPANPV